MPFHNINFNFKGITLQRCETEESFYFNNINNKVMNKYLQREIKILIYLIVLVFVMITSYYCGRHESRDYQAACVLKHICNNMMVNLGNDAEEIYFDCVDNLDCYSNIKIDKDYLENYNENLFK